MNNHIAYASNMIQLHDVGSKNDLYLINDHNSVLIKQIKKSKVLVIQKYVLFFEYIF